MTLDFRPATPADAPAIAALYNQYVAMPAVTFEFDPVSPETTAARIADVQAAGLPWLVATDGEALVAYAYASPWKAARAAYRFSAETSIYVDPARTGQRIGVPLYLALIDALRERGIHSAIGGILLPNEASERLHARLGFTRVAHFREVGCKRGQWLDVAYWQLHL